jgi:hypothetical protein
MKDTKPDKKRLRPPLDEAPEESVVATEPPTSGGTALSDLSDKALKKKLLRYTEEFQIIASDQSQVAMTRRVELVRLMRGVQDVVDAREPIVEVTVTRSVTGEPYQVGPKTFHPGIHRMRASVAQYLLWMMAENQRVELNRLKQNGRTIDLGTIGSKARMATISRDSGDDDWRGRGG